jgi:hypothetical protein
MSKISLFRGSIRLLGSRDRQNQSETVKEITIFNPKHIAFTVALVCRMITTKETIYKM